MRKQTKIYNCVQITAICGGNVFGQCTSPHGSVHQPSPTQGCLPTRLCFCLCKRCRRALSGISRGWYSGPSQVPIETRWGSQNSGCHEALFYGTSFARNTSTDCHRPSVDDKMPPLINC
jgi:hypothetical protein